jgi:hypothetical protein
LISWLDFILDNLFLCFGQRVYRQFIDIPMGTNSAVYLTNLFPHEFDFMKRLSKSNTCFVLLHSLYLVRRFVDDLFVLTFLDFENFMYLHPNSFGSGTYQKMSCELNCTSQGISCNFLDLTVSRNPQG